MAATTATGSEVEVTNADGVRLSLSRSGPFDGRPVVLLHGLAVTRDHVLMGSTALADAGFHVVAFDARGHGRSAAAPDPTAYRYQDLTGDLVAVMDGLGIERAVLVGASMGCHTALRVALQEPARVAGIVAITPAFDPRKPTDPRELDDARRVADLMRRDGVDGFMEGLALVGDPLVEIAPRAVRKRMALHRDLSALADALEHVVRSQPFDSLAELSAIKVPTLVVASRDKLDPGHRYESAVAYHNALPHSELCCEPEGRAPMAWSRRKLGPRVLEFTCTLE